MTLVRLGVAAAVVSLVLGTACSDQSEPDISLPSDAVRDGDVAGNGDGGGADAPGSDTGDAGDAGDAESDVLGDESFVVAQAIDDTLVVRTSAQAGAEELVALSAADEVSGKIICLVSQQVGQWVEVELPSGRSDRSGWVARDDVALSRHSYRIEVSRSDHSITLYTGQVAAVTAPVALGPDAPAAGGHLFIKDLVKAPDPSGVYGEYAYGLSGSHNDLTAFRQGAGVVAVHGIGDPSGLGGDVPYGAIAVGADVITRMVDTIGLPLGTPVEIVE